MLNRTSTFITEKTCRGTLSGIPKGNSDRIAGESPSGTPREVFPEELREEFLVKLLNETRRGILSGTPQRKLHDLPE